MLQIEAILRRLVADPLPRVLMISHGIGGGVERHVHELAEVLQGRAHVLLLEPVSGRRMLRVSVPNLVAPAGEGQPAPVLRLAYRWPKDAQVFWQLLGGLRISRVHIHHVQGFAHEFWPQLQQQGFVYDLTLHDHSIFTGHASLVNSKGVFDPAWVAQGLASLPQGKLHFALSLQGLAVGAQRVFVPSAQLLQTVHTLLPNLAQKICLLHRAHPDAESVKAYPQPYLRTLAPQEPLRVLCLGMLSIEKGAGVLAQVAQSAHAAAAPLDFTLLGSCHVPLPAAVKRLGSYADTQVQALIAQIDPHLVWLPAQCPETWSYTLSCAFKAGLPVLTSAIGVFPERLQGRPLSWQCAHRADAQHWLQALLKIRQLHVSGLPVEFWSWLPPPAFYSGRVSTARSETDALNTTYWLDDPAPPELALSAAVLAGSARAYRYANRGAAKWRSTLMTVLSWLRNTGCLTPVVRLIPYRWQQKIKRLISREPLAERRKQKSRK